MARSQVSLFFRGDGKNNDGPAAKERRLIRMAMERIIQDGRKLQELEPDKDHFENAVDFAKSLYYSES
jgi:hypothetical protein